MAKMVPEILVRAGTTGDVYALLESATIPGRNVVELSKEGDKSFRPMGALPLTKGLAIDGPTVQQFLFANAEDGVAVAPPVTTSGGMVSPLFVTRDGGRTSRRFLRRHRSELAASTPEYLVRDRVEMCDGQRAVFAVSTRESPGRNHAMDSARDPPPLARYGSVMNITSYGSDVWLSTMDQDTAPFPSYIAISHNSESPSAFRCTHH